MKREAERIVIFNWLGVALESRAMIQVQSSLIVHPC